MAALGRIKTGKTSARRGAAGIGSAIPMGFYFATGGATIAIFAIVIIALFIKFYFAIATGNFGARQADILFTMFSGYLASTILCTYPAAGIGSAN